MSSSFLRNHSLLLYYFGFLFITLKSLLNYFFLNSLSFRVVSTNYTYRLITYFLFENSFEILSCPLSFMLHYNGRVEKLWQVMWLAHKHNIFTILAFKKNFADLCSRTMPLWGHELYLGQLCNLSTSHKD